LVRLPPSASAAIPHDSREFLVRAGLPALVRLFPGSTDGVITFSRLAAGLSPVLGEKTVGPPLTSEWSAYWIVGDEFFCNGAAWAGFSRTGAGGWGAPAPGAGVAG